MFNILRIYIHFGNRISHALVHLLPNLIDNPIYHSMLKTYLFVTLWVIEIWPRYWFPFDT